MEICNQFKLGTYTGSGVAQTLDIGFKPVAILLFNETDGDWLGCHIDNMSAATAYKFTTGIAKISTNGITLNDFGFTVGSDATLNENLKVYRYLALGSLTNQVASFAYTGTGAAQSINFGFKPQAVLAFNTTDNDYAWGSIDGDTSTGGCTYTDGGFSLGTSATDNENLKAYKGVAIGNITNQVSKGTYTGTAATQTITLGYKPLLVGIGNNTDDAIGTGFLRSMTADSGLSFALNSDLITAGVLTTTGSNMVTLTDTGFTVGSSDIVNKSGDSFNYVAI